jgi:phenylacetate-CoA ligase
MRDLLSRKAWQLGAKDVEMYTALAEKLIYPLGDRLFSTRIVKNLRELEDTQWWSLSQLQDLQTKKLQKLVEHAYENVPFYRARLEERRLRPEDVQSVQDLTKLPILTKRDVKENSANALLARNVASKDVLPGMTGGSTGIPLQFARHVDSTSRDWAAALRAWGWAGYRLGDKYATLWGHPLTIAQQASLKGRLQNLFMRNLFLSAYNMDNDSLSEYAHKLERYKPRFLRGYASAVHALASTIERKQAHRISPRAIFTTSEMLFDSQRALIEEQFGCKVFDHYGSGEVHSVAHECEYHSGYHVTSENMIVEVVKKDSSLAMPGERGELVVTDLHNYASPFIRYNTEDAGILSETLCPCGRGLPLLSALEGRSSEIIVLPNGRLVPLGYWVVLFETVSGVDQYQIVQEAPSSLVVKIVKNLSFTEDDLTHITANLRRLGGEELDYEIKMVEGIPVSASGKRRFVITQVDRLQDVATAGEST